MAWAERLKECPPGAVADHLRNELTRFKVTLTLTLTLALAVALTLTPTPNPNQARALDLEPVGEPSDAAIAQLHKALAPP